MVISQHLFHIIKKHPHLIGFSLAIFGTLLFSLKSIFIKLLYRNGLNADSVLLLRMVISLPFYSFILLWLYKSQRLSKQLTMLPIFKIILLGFFGYYLASLLDLMSLSYISAQLERLGLFTYPFMVAILGWLFFKQSIDRILVLALIISYVGLWLVVGQEQLLTGNNVLLGTALVLASALSFSLYVLMSQSMIKSLGSTTFTSIAMIGSSLFVFIHAYFFVDIDILTLSHSSWVLLFLLAIFSTVIPSYMLTEAINLIGPSQTGLMGTLGPVFTIVLAIYILGENFTLLMGVGIFLVIFGVLMKMLNKSK